MNRPPIIEPIEILRAARATLADPRRFTRGTYARGPNGHDVRATEETAVCWCAYGALRRHGGHEEGRSADLLRAAAKRLFGIPPTSVNDELGHQAVLRMFDDAITQAGTEAAS